MKTTPLDEALKQITPLPYRVSSHDALRYTFHIDAGPAGYDRKRVAIVTGDCKRDGSEANAAYLAHAANVLPGLVELLELAANQAVTLANLVEDERSLYKADEAAFRQALATATNVPVNS